MTMERKSWEEFRNDGMLWFVNRMLHVLGYVLVYEYDESDQKVVDVYPARSSYRGFSGAVETEGFKKVSGFMENNAKRLNEEANAC